LYIEERIEELGLILPPPLTVPSELQLPFVWVRICGNRALISGHIPQNPDGSIVALRGKVGRDISVNEAYLAARFVALSMLSSIRRALGDLDRVVAWLRVYGMVNATSDFTQHPHVINGFSDLIVELYGSESGYHARSAVGLACLPFDVPVEIEAEIEFR